MGSGCDGKGRGGGSVAKSLQSKPSMVSSRAQVCVRTQHMEGGVSAACAGLQTLASLRQVLACEGGRGL